MPLFRKHGRKTVLTEQGEIALRYARRVLELNDEMIDTLRGSSLAGVVRIGFAQDFTGNVLPLVIARFNAHYPLVKLEVTVDPGPGPASIDRLRRSRSCFGVRRCAEKDGAPVERAAVALDRKSEFQGSRTAAITACSLQSPVRMSDTGTGGTGKCWTPLARCNDEPQPDGLVGRCQCGTGTDHSSRTWPAGRRADH